MKEADAPIDEIREIRHRISEELGHDPQRIVAYYAHLDKELSERSFVESPPEPIPSDSLK